LLSRQIKKPSERSEPGLFCCSPLERHTGSLRVIQSWAQCPFSEAERALLFVNVTSELA
jgi:hypothetical protein